MNMKLLEKQAERVRPFRAHKHLHWIGAYIELFMSFRIEMDLNNIREERSSNLQNQFRKELKEKMSTSAESNDNY